MCMYSTSNRRKTPSTCRDAGNLSLYLAGQLLFGQSKPSATLPLPDVVPVCNRSSTSCNCSAQQFQAATDAGSHEATGTAASHVINSVQHDQDDYCYAVDGQLPAITANQAITTCTRHPAALPKSSSDWVPISVITSPSSSPSSSPSPASSCARCSVALMPWPKPVPVPEALHLALLPAYGIGDINNGSSAAPSAQQLQQSTAVVQRSAEACRLACCSLLGLSSSSSSPGPAGSMAGPHSLSLLLLAGWAFVDVPCWLQMTCHDALPSAQSASYTWPDGECNDRLLLLITA
jgi:hypothetical protein